MKKEDFYWLIKIFLGWRLLLFVFLFLALRLIPLQKDFLGGGMENYLKNPWLWSWANFDGEHYLTIAREGYRPLTYFFFPVYPMLVKALGIIGGFRRPDFLAFAGLLVSHISFFLALVGFYKLVRLDKDAKTARLAILLLVFFPTSFFFASFYTESLFLASAVWSFYFARRGDYILAGLLGAVSSATRILGIALVPALAVEAYKDGKKNLLNKVLGIALIPLGLVLYMYFLKVRTGDPLEFFNTVSIFGEQRSTELVLLPQVFFRYLFKILPSLNYPSFPQVFTTYLEILSGGVFFILSILSFFRQRLSYSIYFLISYLIPTLSGSFSSFPRYALVLFPGFILGAYLLRKRKWLTVLVLSALCAGLAVATMFFVRGIWIS
ncbi:MAG: mannosyltransferase family protein [Patescibacteria group bacterium]